MRTRVHTWPSLQGSGPTCPAQAPRSRVTRPGVSSQACRCCLWDTSLLRPGHAPSPMSLGASREDGEHASPGTSVGTQPCCTGTQCPPASLGMESGDRCLLKGTECRLHRTHRCRRSAAEHSLQPGHPCSEQAGQGGALLTGRRELKMRAELWEVTPRFTAEPHGIRFPGHRLCPQLIEFTH